MSFNNFTKTLRIKNNLLQSYDPRDIPDNGEYKEHRKVKAIKRRLFKLFYIIFCLLPINKKKVVFASDSRSELNGNFYFVYEELYKRNLNLNIKFVFNERINNKKTVTDLIKTAYQFATSKIILLDDFYPLVYPLRIRNNADLVQVWHAAGAFKTFGYSRIGRPGGPSPRSKNHKNYTKAVVSSEGVRKNYAEGFGITEDKVYPTGVPRSDVFFDEDYKSHVRHTLHEKYPFLKSKKVILFAPTFRGNGQASAHYPFEMLDLRKLYDALHEDYVFLFKIHPFVQNKFTIPYEYADFFYDFSDYREINDLLLVTDILITDYSSVCFEFALLNKPMLFFAFDVENYIEERDFYYNFFTFIPGPLLKTTTEIIETIKKGNFQLEKIKPFVNYFFDDTLGKASKNVVDEIIIPSLEDVEREEREDAVNLTPPASRIELFERSIAEENQD
jgi:CDP-ribitol ribitolphosphotransferase